MRKFWIVFVVLSLALGMSCKKKSEKAKEAPKVEEKAEVKEATEKEVTTGKMTDDIWVEMFAYTTYITGKYAAKAEKVKTTAGTIRLGEEMGKEMENVYKKFGVTGDEFSAYTEKLGENPEYYVKLMERVGKQIEELQKEGK
ncbi:hypothetical protein KAW65_06685 [candidate division WOR-3 bacterium]|nr:hypothetical protein [candidate division WOR-3 bacterium]